MKLGLRELVFVVLLMAIPLGSYAMIFRPANARELTMKKEIQAKQAKLAQLKNTTGTIGNIQQETESMEKGINTLSSKLPSEKEIDKILQEVWQLAESNKLITKSIRTMDKDAEPTFAAAGGPYAEQPITMKLEGDFLGFYSFMLALESQPRIMRIRKMTLTRPETGPDGYVQAVFEMTVFFERFTKDDQ